MNKHSWVIEKRNIDNVDGKSYTINGKVYCRVTKTLSVIAKNGLLSWYMRVGKSGAEKIMKNRQVLGTQVHSMFEKILQGEEVYTESFNQEIQMDIRLFRNFIEHCIVKMDECEQNLYSDEHGYAGTCDFIGTYKTHEPYLVRGHKAKFTKKGFVIGDWKTSRDIYDDYWLQLAAYAHAFYELTGLKVDGAFIAQFRDGKIRIKEMTWDELMAYFEVYKAVLVVYRWKYGLEDEK